MHTSVSRSTGAALAAFAAFTGTSAGPLASGCGGVDDPPRADTTIVLAHPVGRAFTPPAEATILLRGYDSTVIDTEATVIAIYRFPVDELPVSLGLDIPAEPHALIEQGLVEVEAEDARFYFTVYVDVDGDNDICPGDYGQDWVRTEYAEYELALPRDLEIFVEEKGAEFFCRPPVPE